MNDSNYKDIEHGERVVFKGKVKLNPRSKDAEIVDCYVTEGSVVIESTEPLRIPLDRIEDCSVSLATSYITYVVDYLAGGRSTVGTITLGYRDASEQSRKAEFEMSAADSYKLRDTLDGLLRQRRWRDAWSRGLACPTQPAVKPAKRHMRLFHKIVEKRRDKTRDRLCADLYAIGLDALMVEWGELEQDLFLYYAPSRAQGSGRSLGLIEIQHSPIRLVNVLKGPAEREYGGGIYRSMCLVPDPSVWTKGYLQVEAKFVRAKSGPVRGNVVDIDWKSYFEDDLLRRLEQDVSLKQALIKLEQEIRMQRRPEWLEQIEIRIQRHSELGCWAIWPPAEEGRLTAPSKEEWDCYEMIARRLLELGEK